jgi:hypothetical protein
MKLGINYKLVNVNSMDFVYITLTDERANSIHCEFTDYKVSDCSPSIMKEIVPTLFMKPTDEVSHGLRMVAFENATTKRSNSKFTIPENVRFAYGDTAYISSEIEDWLGRYADKTNELVIDSWYLKNNGIDDTILDKLIRIINVNDKYEIKIS